MTIIKRLEHEEIRDIFYHEVDGLIMKVGGMGYLSFEVDLLCFVGTSFYTTRNGTWMQSVAI